ncbi:MAG: PP2C family protein-serine/threonine phosphatase [bacterium]
MSVPDLSSRPVDVAVWGRTDPGKERDENQDSFLVMELAGEGGDEGFLLRPHGGAPEAARRREFTLGPRGALLLVADGMGGAAGGALASRTAVEEIRRALKQEWGRERGRTPQRFGAHLVSALEEANRTLHELARDRADLRGMGTTATAAGLLEDFLYVAQVGDSRAYLIREGTATQITRDQSVVQHLVDAGAMTPDEAERSSQKNVILQALGTAEKVEVDLTYQQLRNHDLVLLCSDGLSGVLQPRELAESARRFPDPPALCEALVELANTRGSPDNVTVIVARVQGEGLADPRPEDRVGRTPFRPGEP